MAASPPFKVYTAYNEYIGCVKYAEDASMLVNLYGDGATVRLGHAKRATLLTVGTDTDGDSADRDAALIYSRLRGL